MSRERWTHEQVNALEAEKGFLPEEYWPLEYVWKNGKIYPPSEEQQP
jgi:hypothetical protein